MGENWARTKHALGTHWAQDLARAKLGTSTSGLGTTWAGWAWAWERGTTRADWAWVDWARTQHELGTGTGLSTDWARVGWARLDCVRTSRARVGTAWADWARTGHGQIVFECHGYPLILN
jgi:hypothetical protein